MSNVSSSHPAQVPAHPAQAPATPAAPAAIPRAAVARAAVAPVVPSPAKPSAPALHTDDDGAPPNYLVKIVAPSSISTVVHLVLLIVLGLVVSEPAMKPRTVGLVATSEVEVPELDQLEAQEVEREVPQGMTLDTSRLLADATAVSDPTATGAADVVIERADLTPGMTGTTVGKGGASFFGAVAKGKRFVFVVDNSNSMGSKTGKFSKFERAKAELLESISKLGKDKSYYIVFFNATPTRIFDPEPAMGFVPATKENYDKLYSWLAGLRLDKGTRGKGAMQIALDLKPDAIYILSDGAFTDDTADSLGGMNTYSVPIHTLLFAGKGAEKGVATMERIAKEHHGTYLSVD